MAGYNGGFLGGSILPTASQKQPGVWSLQEAYRGRVGGKWPSIATITAATGGTDVYNLVVSGTTYAVHQFTNVGTFDFVLSETKTIEYLIIAGGGAGGVYNGKTGGGGGAGGFLAGSDSFSPGTYTVTVGDGGPATSASAGIDGEDSVFGALIAVGGGGGNGRSGGSGGGGSGGSAPGGSATTGQGSNGGGGGGPVLNSFYWGITCGGGGGAGGAGGGGQVFGSGGPASNSLLAQGGNGGPGKISDITGTPRYYAGGGGGGYSMIAGNDTNPGQWNPDGALGGIGGGGNARLSPYGRLATSGVPNTGGGGGAGGGAGGSGIVVLRYVVS